jgi:hypothetical protein
MLPVSQRPQQPRGAAFPVGRCAGHAAAAAARRGAARRPPWRGTVHAAPPQTVLEGGCYEDIIEQLAGTIVAAADRAAPGSKYIVGIAGGPPSPPPPPPPCPPHGQPSKLMAQCMIPRRRAARLPNSHLKPSLHSHNRLARLRHHTPLPGICNEPSGSRPIRRSSTSVLPLRRPASSPTSPGGPGSGKSTLSRHLCRRLNEICGGPAGSGGSGGAPAAAVVPMDGFHFYRRQLDAMPDPRVRRGQGAAASGPRALATGRRL